MAHNSLNSLQQSIVEHIQHNGPITFADYMRMALYAPGSGYYMTGPARMGWEGDYYTSVDVSAFFAHCIGRQLLQMWELLGHPTPFIIMEQGAGHGNLAHNIQQWAEQEAPAFKAALDYRCEDIRAGQDALTHNDAIPSVILSNELVDAFPVHIVEMHNKKLYEVYIAVQPDGRLYEILDEPSSQEVATYLDSYKIPWTTFAEGWRAEINLDALHWMAHTTQRLVGNSQRRKRHGFLLIIDYGDKARALYTKSRQYGTLTCYFQHQLSASPLIRPGTQDITAHVNFSALINEGRQQGLRLHTFTTQHLWLKEMGIHEELERVRTRDFAIIDSARATNQGQVALLQWYNLRQGVTTLTNQAGMGNFKVLILKR